MALCIDNLPLQCHKRKFDEIRKLFSIRIITGLSVTAKWVSVNWDSANGGGHERDAPMADIMVITGCRVNVELKA